MKHLFKVKQLFFFLTITTIVNLGSCLDQYECRDKGYKFCLTEFGTCTFDSFFCASPCLNSSECELMNSSCCEAFCVKKNYCNSSGPNASGVIIVAIVVPVVFFVILITCMVVCMVRKARRRAAAIKESISLHKGQQSQLMMQKQTAQGQQQFGIGSDGIMNQQVKQQSMVQQQMMQQQMLQQQMIQQQGGINNGGGFYMNQNTQQNVGFGMNNQMMMAMNNNNQQFGNQMMYQNNILQYQQVPQQDNNGIITYV